MKKLNLTLMASAIALAIAAPALPALADEAVEVTERGAVEAAPVETPSMLRVDFIKVEHADSALNLAFHIDAKRVSPGRDRQVVFTPVVRSNDPAVTDSIVLPSLTVAGRNRYYSHLRNGDLADGELIYRAGDKADISYAQSIPWQAWMENGYIYMREETQDCCKPVKPLCDTPVAQIGTIAAPPVKATNSAGYIALTNDETIEMELQGSAFVDFIVNRTEIEPQYRKNPRELKKIIESIDKVREDPDATITRLTIKGYASPEGSYANNVRLAMGRTESLKEYVRKMYDFDPEIMMTDYEPEDWAGLRRWLEACDLPHRAQIIEIVDSSLEPDPKDQAIKRQFPKEYKLILDSVYPGLRHSDYTVRYKIRTYVDIEELKKVFRDHPERLRPVDFYRIAQTFPVGSREFDEVLLLASDTHPNDEEAAINAANILMRRGDLQEASRKISRGGERGEAYFTRGMLAALNEDFDRAERFFQKAQELGVAEAGAQLQRLKQSKSREIIQILLQPEGDQ